MNPEEINKLIKDLEREIRDVDNDEERELGLLQLQSIAKDYNGDDRVISSLELAEELKSRPPQKKILTGYKGLDDILDGFRHKQLVVISAPTKSGKTTFCVELTIRLKELSPLWIPFEEPAEEIIQKFLDRNEQPPLFYTPKKILGNTLAWVEKKIIEAKVKNDAQIVFIDHLHFIVPPGSDEINQRIGLTMRELKKMAVRWNVVIVLIAHLRKTKMDIQPDLEDLRDSSFIAQEADTVMILWRKTTREQGKVVIGNEMSVSVQANRRTGKTGNVNLIFNNGRFEEDPMDEKFEKTGTENW